jgi:hypothetical protein
MTSTVDTRSGSRGGRLRSRLGWLGTVVVLLLLAVPAAASADATLGTTSQPTGSNPNPCFGNLVAQLTSDATTPYTVPAGGGEITQWQINTAQATAGAPITFVVLRPLGGNTYSVVAADTESLPAPLPADNAASFTLATPISVNGGETLGLYGAQSNSPVCFWSAGSTPPGDSLIALGDGTPPNPGQTLGEITNGGTPTSGPGFTLNLSATLVSREDAGVTTTAPLPNPSVGAASLLASTVSDVGPGSSPITFTDDVPTGLQIDSVVAGSGTCAVSGQQVTCTISGLAPGQSAPVDIVVTPGAAGSYPNAVTVNPPTGITDPNPANNTASATLAVPAPPAPAAPPTAKCVVPALRGIPAAFARRVLGLLGCTVGKVSKVHSRVAKGAVVSASPGAGTYAAGKVVALQVSSGPKPTRKRTRA